MKSKLERLRIFLKGIVTLGSIKAAYEISRYQFNYKAGTLKRLRWKNNKFEIIATGQKLSPQNMKAIAADLDLLELMGKVGTYDFQLDEIYFFVRTPLEELKFFVPNHDILATLKDIFADEVYKFDEYKNLSFVVLDVGMNVGTAALYFATRKNVKAVVGYEPLKANYDFAKRNFSFNPVSAKKIEANPYGLDDRPQTLQIPYTHSGDIGFSTTTFIVDAKKARLSNIESVNIEVLPIDNEVRKIVEKYPDENIFLKLDCEGAEYSIIPDLAAKDLFKTIKFIQLEWHFKGPEKLIEILTENGYTIIESSLHYNNLAGIVKAYKQ